MKISGVGQYLLVFTIICWPPSNIYAEEPVVTDAIKLVAEAFENHPLVGIGENVHESRKVYDFYKALLSDPKIYKQVDDIIYEVANARYQSLIDDYLNGKDIDDETLASVWRDITNSPDQIGSSLVHLDFFKFLRALNQELPEANRYRLVAADPPTNWANITDAQQHRRWLSMRTSHQLSVINRQVISKGRKGLLIIGNGHLLEKVYGDDSSLSSELNKNQQQLFRIQMSQPQWLQNMASWPNESAAMIKNTTLGQKHWDPNSGDLSLADEMDAILHIAPQEEIFRETAPAYTEKHPFWPEYQRRKSLLAANPFHKNTPGRKADRNDLKALLFEVADLAKAYYHQTDISDNQKTFAGFNPDTEELTKGAVTVDLLWQESEPQLLKMKGTLYESEDRQSPEMEIHVSVDQDGFAITQVKRH